MTEWTTLSVKENTLTRFRDIKEQLDETQDAPDHSADSFLQSLLDTWEAAEDGYYDEETVAETLMQEHFPERENDDIEEAKREILNRLDDLQSQLPKDVAGELQR